MKIIGGKTDYYDSARFFGGLPPSDTMLIRKGSETFFDPKACPEGIFEPPDTIEVGGVYYDGYLLYFCGKVYALYQYKSHPYDFCHNLHTIYFGESGLKYKDLVEAHNQKFPDLKRARVPKHDPGYCGVHVSPNWNTKYDQGRILYFPKNVPEHLFRRYGAYFIVHNHFTYGQIKLISYPILKDFEFYKVFPAPLAYQELERFVGTVMVGEKVYPQVTEDRILIEKKGFDNKTSFRRTAPKKRKQKKRSRK